MYEKIKKICLERNLSMAQVEKAAGLSNGLISKWKECSPSIDKVKKVAEYLGVTVDELIS